MPSSRDPGSGLIFFKKKKTAKCPDPFRELRAPNLRLTTIKRLGRGWGETIVEDYKMGTSPKCLCRVVDQQLANNRNPLRRWVRIN